MRHHRNFALMSNQYVTFLIEKLNRKDPFRELDFSNQFLFNVPNFGKTVQTSSYKQVLLGKYFDIIDFPVVIEGCISFQIDEVVHFFIKLEQLSFSRLESH